MSKKKWKVTNGKVVIPHRYISKRQVDVNQPFEISIEYGCIVIKPFDFENIESRPYVGVMRYINDKKYKRLNIPSEFLKTLGFNDGYYRLRIVDEKIIISKGD